VRVLSEVDPTPEQLKIIKDYSPGVFLIRGAAGSGKTTTAVLRLYHVTNVWWRQRQREESDVPVRVLVLTYNRTLRGYVEQLVEAQLNVARFELTLDTFGHWAWQLLGRPRVINDIPRENKLARLGQLAGLRLPSDFLADEVDYVCGRFPADKLADYASPDARTYERRGRGTVPRMERPTRQRLLDQVITPYKAELANEGLIDWNDIAIRLATSPPALQYDVIIVDEAQDFSANQIRAVMNYAQPNASVTLVLDAVQRIYPRGFDWTEAGVDIARSERLSRNFRNTKQIAAFALPLVRDLPLEDDGTLPEFKDSERGDGRMPFVVRGLFHEQMDWVIDYINNLPEDESVALLQPKGGRWTDYPQQRLEKAGLPFVVITRKSEWPQGPEEIAISTLHSSKGLEFDHVIILGVAAEQMPHGPEDNDTQLANHRRLIAMGIGRARKSVALTYKPGEESKVVHLLDPKTYTVINL
jgi:superfamily I DNA/RNA helicase